jgi:membrane-bound serine protease (ClpP class)
VADLKVASHGILTVGGIVAMVLGSFMLYDMPESGLRISWLVILPTVGATAGLVILAVSMGVRALRRPPTTGATGMVGQVGRVQRALDPEGQVLVDGELWQAVTRDGPVAAGENVEIVSVDGLTLTVIRSGRRA